MSKRFLMICDGCSEQRETVSDDPADVTVPSDWITVHRSGRPDRHYCSAGCLGKAYGGSLSVPVPPVARPVRKGAKA